MAGNEDFDADKDSQLFPQHDTEGSDNDSQDNEQDKAGDDTSGEPGPAGGKEAKGAPDTGPDTGKDQGQGKGDEAKPKDPPPAFDPADINLPEGLKLDEALLGEFATAAGQMSLTQEQAQELVDLQVKALQAQEAQHLEARRAWVESLQADPEFGGTRFDGTVNDAQAVLRRFDGDGQVLDVLQASGFGDHPAIIKMLARIKRSISEDEFVTGTDKPGEKKSLNERLWPDM